MVAYAETGRVDWKRTAEKAQGRIKTIYEEQKEQIRFAADTVETFLAGGIIGWIHGRNGGIPKRLGVPLDLGLMVLLKIGAFVMSAKKIAGAADVHAFGNGVGAYYFGTMGLEIGQRQLAAKKDSKGNPVALGHPLSDKEAADMGIDPRTNTVLAGAEQQRTQIGEGSRRVSQSQSYQVARAPQPVARIFR
jgi:hypothetical protein